MSGLGEGGAVGGAADGRAADLVGVGVAGGFAGHHPQAEAFGRIIGRGFQAAVVEDQRLQFRAFEEQLAVVGARQRVLEDGQGLVRADVGGFEDGGRLNVQGHAVEIGGEAGEVTGLTATVIAG